MSVPLSNPLNCKNGNSENGTFSMECTPRPTPVRIFIRIDLDRDPLALQLRGLDAERAQRVPEYVQRVRRRPVLLRTIGSSAEEVELSASAAA